MVPSELCSGPGSIIPSFIYTVCCLRPLFQVHKNPLAIWNSDTTESS
uniref:Uncharacterized protein n=1 Tax=Lepeophtheirus salmonis TaxID=72036 RepID=A0A0K2UP54_LEPSM